MLLFVKRYKEEVLGVGEVALPGEGAALIRAAAQRAAKEPKDSSDHSRPPPTDGSTNGTPHSTETEYVSPEGFAGAPKGHRGVTFTPPPPPPKSDPTFPSPGSTVAVAEACFPRRVRRFMLSAPVTIAPCGTPTALRARRAARGWWTWCTFGPTRSCFADATTARASGLDAPAATRWVGRVEVDLAASPFDLS